MRTTTVAFVIVLAAACGGQSREEHRLPEESAGLASPVVSAPAPLKTWFDPVAAAQIMAARATFDAAENTILAEAARIVGPYHDVMVISREHYRQQRAGHVQQAVRSAGWRYEQQRRAAYADVVTRPKMAAARDALKKETLSALRAFFERELSAERISRSHYRRYTSEIREGVFPDFRPRKWAGPAIYEFRGTTVSPEYRAILREVRRLWQAQGRRESAIIWTHTTPEFYAILVPPKH